MARKSEGAESAPTDPQHAAAPSFRLLVNPSGQMIPFKHDDPRFEAALDTQRPSWVKPAEWFREATPEEFEAFLKRHPAMK